MKRIWIGILLVISVICCAIAVACGSNAPKRLNAPQNLRMEENRLVWDEVENATGYAVYFSNTEKTINECYYDFTYSDSFNKFEVEVLAIGDGVNYLDSDWVKYNCTLSDLSYGLAYSLNYDGTGYIVSKGKAELGEEIYIPDYYNRLPVKEINNKGFAIKDTSTLGEAYLPNETTKRIRLPAMLEKIGIQAFYRYENLIEIEIPEGVTSIGKRAFSECGIYHVSLPKSLKKIEDDAFSNCNNLSNVVFPEGITIGDKAFLSCGLLSEITFSKNVTIGYGSFAYCESLTEITFPEGTTIGSKAFLECDLLSKITFPEGTTIGYAAFLNCDLLSEITFPEGTSIGQYAFLNCPLLSEITFYEGVTVDPGAFSGCTALKKIDCSQCSYVGDSAFRNCTALTEIVFPEDPIKYDYSAFTKTGWYENQPDGYVIVNGDTLFHYKGDIPNEGVIDNFPSEIEKIAGNAFSQSNPASITIPDGVQLCGNGIFQECNQLKQVRLPIGITNIPANTFRGCSALESIEIPEGVTKIGKFAFGFCKALTAISLPSTLEEIEESTFSSCDSLKKLYLPDSLKTVDPYALPSNIEEIILPVSLNTISKSKFKENTKIYYRGTEEDWNAYFAETDYNATRYYYSENPPSDGGNYWHFESDGTTPVEW